MSNANRARVTVAAGESLDVRSFTVQQAMSRLFRIDLVCVSRNLDIDFDELIGKEASFELSTLGSTHGWSGLAVEAGQARVDEDGLGTYTLSIAPRAVLLTQRKNHRIFQYQSEIEIVQALLGEWGVAHDVRVGAHKARKYRVQYGESDFDFMRRLLEDAGISFFFEDAGGVSTLVLSDGPERGDLSYPAVRFHDNPGVTDGAFVTKVMALEQVRPGRQMVGDLDYRRGSGQQPRLSASAGLAQESALEQFDYEPGVFLFEGGSGDDSPTADDRGVARTDESAGSDKTAARLAGRRSDATVISLESSLVGLAPGVLMSVSDHPHHHLEVSRSLLVTSSTVAGEHAGDWRAAVQLAPSDKPYKPAMVAPRPRVSGVDSATVVGPSAEEVHTDEFGRVRVRFHWDRTAAGDETSSCWIPTNQPWAGAGFGAVAIPRIGQEVFVEYLGGDPDRPVVVGRVFTESNPSPVKLPEGKRTTGFMGKQTPVMVTGAWGEYTDHDFEDMFNSSPGRSIKADPAFNTSAPEGVSPYLKSNAFFVGDANGKDVVFLRAEKDLSILVKNSWTTVVGNYRATKVVGNDVLEVVNKQKIEVIENVNLVVNKDQTQKTGKVRKEEVEDSIGLNVLQTAFIKVSGDVRVKAKKGIVLEAKERIGLKVGASEIRISPQLIELISPHVSINPDAEPGRKAREAAAKAEADREAANAKALADRYRALKANGQLTSRNMGRAAQDLIREKGITDSAEIDRLMQGASQDFMSTGGGY